MVPSDYLITPGARRRIPKRDETAVLFAELDEVARKTLQAAGPRYSPSLDPDAPNLEIVPLHRAASALALGSIFRDRLAALGGAVKEECLSLPSLPRSVFKGRRITPESVAIECKTVSGLPTDTAHDAVRVLRGHARLVTTVLDSAVEAARTRTDAINGLNPPADSDESRELSKERDRLRSRVGSLQRLLEPIGELTDLLDGAEGSLASERNAMLLRGEWGTGKTHFLCDFALESLADRTPTVVVLANELRDDIDPLDAVAEATDLAPSGSLLLDRLSTAARKSKRRGLILIDAVNEADRDAWRKRLAPLLRGLARRRDIGLILSCRTPFDDALLTSGASKQLIPLRHPGFEGQQFDAQLEYFNHYNLPALHVPLLADEFSRPLFLKLMCEGMARLSRTSQRRQLKDIASGQKGMTFVLENFIKHVGAEVEKRHGLQTKTCWDIIKGHPKQSRPGLAGVLAANQREWLEPAEVIEQVKLCTGLDDADSALVVRDMTSAGLLIELSRYNGSGYSDAYSLSYQRFSDHIVARHLLEGYLQLTDADALRRCFYSNRRLGAVFVVDRWGRNYAEPGIASALMIEFPERVKRLAETHSLPSELLFYLPRKRWLVAPLMDPFVDGLHWRGSDAFGVHTERVVDRLLEVADVYTRPRIQDVLFGIAARPDHPWNATWLWSRLSAFSMGDRDQDWSEFLRTIDDDANPHRILAWLERADCSKIPADFATNACRLLALMLTTTDRHLRDRATQALVLLGERHPAALFGVVDEAIKFNDPYVGERALAAVYGVCMRRWADPSMSATLPDHMAQVSKTVLDLVLRPGAPHSTWHSLTRGYAIGILQLLVKVRPRAVSASDRALLTPDPAHAPSPFRAARNIRKKDVDDADDAIGVDFGNYTMGSLFNDRQNYDYAHPGYREIRKQITDRMRRLGYSSTRFADLDQQIARMGEYQRDGHKVDRYGKKYSWIAYFEMYGLRCASGNIDDHPLRDPRSTDADIDPSFPAPPPVWDQPDHNTFDSSPTTMAAWLAQGGNPGYENLVHLSDVDGNRGDWILLDANIHEGVEDGRELRGDVRSMFVPRRSLRSLKTEVAAGRNLFDNGFPGSGADYYTFHGEVPWSLSYGSDVRNPSGKARRLNDRAFDYFSSGWRRGIQVEDSVRRFSWEGHHSALNQTQVEFPAPPIAEFLALRVVGGSSDMVDPNGKLATIYRTKPGPGFGSHFLYMRRDLVERYESARNLTLLHAVGGERNMNYRLLDRQMSDKTRALFQRDVNGFSCVLGLTP